MVRGPWVPSRKRWTRRAGSPWRLSVCSDRGDARRFEREAQLLDRLDHPHIVRLLAHGQDEHGPWLAMEWAAGPSLAELVERGRVRSELAVELVAQLADALLAAHAAGVVHRDVKPANAILASEAPPTLKLVDFGVARQLDATTMMTRTGAMADMPLYMAPEQLRRARVAAKRRVWCCGGAVQLLAGRPPVGAGVALPPWPGSARAGAAARRPRHRSHRQAGHPGRGRARQSPEDRPAPAVARALRALAETGAVAATVEHAAPAAERSTLRAKAARRRSWSWQESRPTLWSCMPAPHGRTPRTFLQDGTILLLFTDRR